MCITTIRVIPRFIGYRTIAIGIAAAVGGCATQAQIPFRQEQVLRGGDSDLTKADADFVTAGYRLVQVDIAEGELAEARSGNPSLRQLAAEIVTKANQLYPELEADIARNGITAPRELPAELRSKLDGLGSKSGRAFDQQYLADQIETHQQAIQANQVEQARTHDLSLRSLAERALPVIQEDLARLQALQTN